MVDIAGRGSWGARYQDGDKSLSGLAEEVFIHHTVTALLPKTASAGDERAHMRGLESIGQSRFGTGISYNVIVFPSGRAYQGVSFDRRGTHTGGRNSTARSISFAGNFDTTVPTDEALATAAAIYAEGKGKWWRGSAPLRGHREVSLTACPGKYLYARLDLIRQGAIEVDNPIGEVPESPKPVAPPRLKIDGRWGNATTERLQYVLGTPRDGLVSSQPEVWRDSNPGLTSGWDWEEFANGSRVISELQRVLGVYRDGKFGEDSIRAFQHRMGTKVDGELWDKSPAIKELQRRLNRGKV